MDPSAPIEGSASLPLPLPPAHPRRLVYLGTPQMAVAPLEALVEAGFEVALVVTGPDKRRGRGSATTPTPVKLAALGLGLPVTHDLADVPGVGADLGVVVAFGQILRRPLLEQLPMVNLHFSLLPRWRGAAPVERAILAGDERTGVCVMAVEEGLDTGGIYAVEELAIRRTSTAAELSEQLVAVGSRLLVEALRSGLGPPAPQQGEPTYAHKLTAADRELVWSRGVRELQRVVQIGGAWSTFRGRRLKVLAASIEPQRPPGPDGLLVDDRVLASDGVMRLLEVQPEGKGPVSARDWIRGLRARPDERLGTAGDPA